MQNIRNIIFDLGGVIMNIDFRKTEEAFHVLGLENFSNHISQFHITDFFEKYETGELSDEEFITGIRGMAGKPLSREQIVGAWNALLLDFPPERIALLKELKTKYRTFLLSNTNSIHHDQFQEKLKREQGVYLEDLFEKAYYSHTARLRKPEAAIFELVLNENNLVPAETLFIDDTASNFPQAEKLGIQVYHLEKGKDITGIGL